MDTQQGTPAWFHARKGKLTASNFGAAAGVNPYCSRRRALKREFGQEKFTGNAACTWGTTNERNAIKDYMVRTGNIVTSKGFFTHPQIPWLGGSPDGLVGDVGMIEVKCPFIKMEPHTEIPVYYYCQVNGLLEILDKQWCDYVTWTPTAFKVYRVYRDPMLWDYLLEKYSIFFAMMQRGCSQVPNMRSDDRKAILAHIATSQSTHVDHDFWSCVEPANLHNMWIAPPDATDSSDEECTFSKRPLDGTDTVRPVPESPSTAAVSEQP